MKETLPEHFNNFVKRYLQAYGSKSIESEDRGSQTAFVFDFDLMPQQQPEHY